jgi:LPXTG-site transpeptidase (sortase) family protein
VLLLIGAGVLVSSLRGSSDPGPDALSGVPGHSAAGQTRAQKAMAVRSAAAVSGARSVPVSLRIPTIGVSVPLSQLGLNADKSAQVPTKYEEPGWYKLGPTPGQEGSAVILGHVDDKQGPAVFFKLKTLKAGDKVDVSLTNGMVSHFIVQTVETYSKSQFPAAKVYASHGYSALQLVTCGGKFDKATGHYESNVVAYTTLASTSPAGK